MKHKELQEGHVGDADAESARRAWGERGPVFKRGGVYHYDFGLDGARHRGSTKCKTRAEALVFVARLQEELRRGRLGLPVPITLREYVPKFLVSYQRSPEQVACARYTLNKVWLPTLGNEVLNRITPAMVDAVKEARLQAKKPATVRKNCNILSALFKKAVRDGHSYENPVRLIEKPHEDEHPIAYVPRNELVKIQGAAGSFEPFITVAVGTGCREGELLRARWSDLGPNGETLTIPKSKAKRVRVIPLAPEVREALKRVPRKLGEERIFWQWQSRRQNLKRFSEICKAAKVRHYRIHDLRHTFASYLVMASVDLYTVAKLLGHSSIVSTQRYAHLSPDYLKLAIGKLRLAEKASGAAGATGGGAG